MLSQSQINAAKKARYDYDVPVEIIATLLKCSTSTVYRHTSESIDELLARGHVIGVVNCGKTLAALFPQ